MDLMKEYKKLVIRAGFKVAIDSDYCKTHKESHSNCAGCESEQGCSRYVGMALVNSQLLLFKPTNYDDFRKQQKHLQDSMKKLLDPELTLEEVKATV